MFNDLPCGHELRNKHFRHMLFRCPNCKKHICGICQGGVAEDPIADRLCDDCWVKWDRRRRRRGYVDPVMEREPSSQPLPASASPSPQ